MRLNATAVAGILCLLCAGLFRDAAASDWKPLPGVSDRALYAREDRATGQEWLAAELRVQATPGAFLALLLDLDNLSSWVSGYRAVEVEARSGISAFLVYVRLDAPLLMRDRDAMVASSISWQDSGLWIGSHQDEGAYRNRGDTVPVKRLESCWQVLPLPGQHLLIRYQGVVDTGVRPKWLATDYSRNALKQTLAGLRQQLARPEYQTQGRHLERQYRTQLRAQPLPSECLRPKQWD